MQIVCDSCGHAGEAAAIDVVAGQVEVTCAACGVAQVLQAGAAPREPRRPVAAAAAPVRVDPVPATPVAAAAPAPSRRLPPVKCPKCGSRQYDERACHTCGLVFAKVREGFRPWERVPPEKRPAVRRADELWQQVEANPGDAGAHKTFVDACKASGISDIAAMRYRHRVADFPDDELSQHYLEQAVRDAHAVAQAMIGAAGGTDGFHDNVKLVRKGVVFFVAVLTVVLFVLVMRVFSNTAGSY